MTSTVGWRPGRRSPATAVLAGALAVLVTLVTLSPAAPARADPRADLRADRERIDEEVAAAEATLEHATERAQAAAARYAAAEAALPAAKTRVVEARGEVVAAEARATTAKREAAQAAEAQAAAAGRLDASVAEVTRAREQVAAFAATAYKGGRIAGLRMLLRARGPSDAITRLGYLDQVAGRKRAAVDELTVARLQAKQAANEATLAHERAEAARRATAAALARAEAAEAAAEAAAAEAAALVATQEEALAVAEAERAESLRRYQQLEAEAARIEAELRAWQANRGGDPAPGSGQRSGSGFRLPVEGWQSSPYGMRYDPFFGVWRMHQGVDIAAPGGAPIYAVADGTVVRAGWYGGYGNFTCLGHGTRRGQGMATCYAHQSAILVGGGESVRRGDVIGRVGTTGASTGNHLHFEVRLDGAPTDPVPFLPGFP